MVARSMPFQRTVEVGTKFEPVRLRLNLLEPAVTWSGDRPVMLGFGLLMLKVRLVAEGPPPGLGLMTVIGMAAAWVRSAAGIGAVNFVLLT